MHKLTLVIGSHGLVGSRFVELFPRKTSLHIPKHFELDILKPEQVKETLSTNDFKVIINFAAFTDVSEAEKQRNQKDGICYRVNVEGVKNLVSSINPAKTHYIHISTDMVFPGSKGIPCPYAENQIPVTDSSKLSWYGFTKAEGERVIKQHLGENATILRLIYPVRAKYKDKLDYLRKPLKLYDENKLYPMFSDQQISVTFIDEAALALKIIVEKKIKGVYHASSTDTTNPYEIVSYLIEKVRDKKDAVQSSSLEEFLKTADNPVRYPEFGGLQVGETEEKLGLKFSSWRQIVDKLVEQGIGN